MFRKKHRILREWGAELSLGPVSEIPEKVLIVPPIQLLDSPRSGSHPPEAKSSLEVQTCKKSSEILDTEIWDISEPYLGATCFKETRTDELKDNNLGLTLVKDGDGKMFGNFKKNNSYKRLGYYAPPEGDESKLCAMGGRETLRSKNLRILPRRPIKDSDVTKSKFLSRRQGRYNKGSKVINIRSSKVKLGDSEWDPEESCTWHDLKTKKEVETKFPQQNSEVNLNENQFPALSKNGNPVSARIERMSSLLEKECLESKTDEVAKTLWNKRPEDEKCNSMNAAVQSTRSSQAMKSYWADKKPSGPSRIPRSQVTLVPQDDSAKKEIFEELSPKGILQSNETILGRRKESCALTKSLLSDASYVEFDFSRNENPFKEKNCATENSACQQRRVQIPAGSNAQRSTSDRKYEKWHQNKDANIADSDVPSNVDHYTVPKKPTNKITFLPEQANPQSNLQSSQNPRCGFQNSTNHVKSLEETKKDPPLMKIILSDPTLWKKLMGQPNILQNLLWLPMDFQERLCDSEILQDLSSKPDVLMKLLDYPTIFQYLAISPFLFRELLNSPTLFEKLLNECDILERLLHQPALLNRLLLNANILEHLLYHPVLLSSLVHQPEVLNSLLEQPALTYRLLTEPLVFLYRLFLVWPVVREIFNHPEIWT